MTPETPHGLVRAIRAALDETERLACEATPGPWRLGVMFGTVIADDGSVARDCSEQDAEHITHNGPAAVLRLVAADRRVLERHQPRRLPPTHYRPEVVECEHCARMCHSRSGLACDDPTDAPWPCDEIRDLCDRLGISPETETPQ